MERRAEVEEPCRSLRGIAETSEDAQKKLRQVMVSLREAKAVGNSPTLLTILLPASADVKEWEQKLGNRPQSRVSQEGEYMQNLSRVSDHWQQFEKVAAQAQRRLRQVAHDNRGRLPKNGIVMFVGSAEGHKDVCFEPPSKLQAPVHLCDSKFHVECLSVLSSEHACYGFIIIDGSGCLCGTVSRHNRQVNDKFSVDLPKKHSKGGQSALRFARLRLEKRHNYLKKVSERATKCFISGDVANISGLIVAGAAEFKSELTSRSLLDPRLQAVHIATLDISYGGESGFDQAISLSSGMLKGLDFVKEKQVISNFLSEVARGRGMCCFGVRETMAALEMGVVEVLIVWDELPVKRLVVKDRATAAQVIMFTSPGSAVQEQVLDIEDRAHLVDWIVERHRMYGAKLEFVSDQSQEGMQFCKGFGGIGGVLQYPVDVEFDEPEDEATDSDSDFA